MGNDDDTTLFDLVAFLKSKISLHIHNYFIIIMLERVKFLNETKFVQENMSKIAKS